MPCFSAELAIDAFSYPDSGQARAAWRGSSDSPPVDVCGGADWYVQKSLALSLPFTSEIDRCYWDRDASLDLSAYDAFTLEIFTESPGPVRSFTLYFRSGNGWYGCSAAPMRPGWHTLLFQKSDFSPEGTPAGWAHVDGIRLSPWRGGSGDTRLVLRKLSALRPPVAIIEGTLTASTYPEETQTVGETSNLMEALLLKNGLRAARLRDEDVTSGRLSGYALAILPYNIVLSSQELSEIRRFAASGGKLMAFYQVPPEVRSLLGVRVEGYLQHNYTGFSFQGAGALQAPERVRQGSWNVVIAAPDRADASVLAIWEDSAGPRPAEPAWLASDTGWFMTHILLAEDVETKAWMLTALCARFLPEAWPCASRAALDLSGQVGYRPAFDDAVADLLSRGVSHPQRIRLLRDLQAAREARTKALTSYGGSDHLAAYRSAVTARASLRRAWSSGEAPWDTPMRAVWEHSGTGAYPGDWARSAAELAGAGITAVFPNFFSGGEAHYPSQYLSHSTQYEAYGDQVAQCVRAAHASGLQVHAWKVNWNCLWGPQEFVDAMRAAGRMQVDVEGKPVDWLCPSNPLNRQLEKDAMLEVALTYAVDGLHFDYIRYPSRESCYCIGCRERFQAQTGITVTSWPRQCYDGDLGDAYRAWRGEQITALVREVHQALAAQAPDVKLSAAVFSDAAWVRENLGQDWPKWVEEGLVDFLCPMDYTDSLEDFSGAVSDQLRIAANRVPIYPGVGFSAAGEEGELATDQVVSQLHAARQLGASGFIVFNYTSAMTAELFPALRSGVTWRPLDIVVPSEPSRSEGGEKSLPALLFQRQEPPSRRTKPSE